MILCLFKKTGGLHSTKSLLKFLYSHNAHEVRQFAGFPNFLASSVPNNLFFKNLSTYKFVKQTESYKYVSSHRNLLFKDFSTNKLPKPSEPKKFGGISWRNLFITLGIGGVFLLGMLQVKGEKQRKIEKERKRELGKAAIGGRFDLVDHTGKPCSSDDFLGKWILIYFGFIHCPDICPEEMEKMVEVVELMEKMPKVPQVLPIFITVDPERDDVISVAKYIKEFSPKIIGLTGTKEQVHQATRAYRVYYSAGPKDIDEDYIVDHTIIMYLVDPDGEFVDYYGQTKTADQVANAIRLQMLKFMKSKNTSWF